MNCLELFKSNSFFGNYIKSDLRNHLITQDNETPSTYQCDIKTFYKDVVLNNKYPKNYFNLILAYPPDKLKTSDIDTLFEILNYYQEENPNLKYIILRTHSLHKYILKHKKEYYNHKTFDTCKYGFTYLKEITFFTNIFIQPKRCMDTCENIVKNKYITYKQHQTTAPNNKIEIPPQLIYQILQLI